MTIQEVLSMYPATQATEWKQRENGAWVHSDATVKESIYLTIGPRVVFRAGTFKEGTFKGGTFEGGTFKGGTFKGGTFEGGTFWGGTFWGGTFKGGTFKGAIIALDSDMATLLNVAEWGPITAHKVKGGWAINCGCRHFTLAEAQAHWENMTDRVGTRRAVAFLAEIAKERGW